MSSLNCRWKGHFDAATDGLVVVLASRFVARESLIAELGKKGDEIRIDPLYMLDGGVRGMRRRGNLFVHHLRGEFRWLTSIHCKPRCVKLFFHLYLMR